MGKNQFSTSIRAFNIGGETKSPFISNRVRTSRYTKLSFLPKAIILQFSRLANIYFLISAIIMEIPGISSLSPMSAIAPFIFVIAVSVIREGFEDLPRQKSDKKVNSSMAQRLERTGEVRNISWADIRVGNIMVLREEAEIPADLVLLATSNRDGMAYIETGSLDGEKNLKPKFTMPDVVKYFNNDKVENQDLYNCRIQAQVPDPNIHYFEGVFFGEDGKKIPLQAKQILLRGAKLKNTDWALGAVVYSGYDTKIMKNAEGKKNKSSNIERLVNKLILAILILQFIVCALMGLFNYFWSASNADKALYLGEDDYVVGDSFIEILSYYILTNTMIPISLIISIEIVKVAQALFIEKDRDMFNPINGESTKVFSSSMNEELGLVGYIFSDKTGTLTSNNMIFKTFVIGDEVYGETRPKLYSSARKTDFDFYAAKDGYQAPSNQTNYPPSSAPLFKRQIQAALAGTALETVDFVEGTGKHFGLNFQTQKDLVIEFMQAVATCHECLAEPGKDPNVIQYQGQSQDEIRLLETAKDGGFAYLGGGIGKKRVRLLNEEKEFEVLQVFEFNSDRKRMSILVRDGRVLKLYTKGADNIVCARLSKKAQQPFQEGIIEKLEEYSKVGYRTLVYAMRIVSEDEYQKITRDIESVADAENRDEAVEKYVDEFEKELFLLGCSAVEDKLQKNVPDVIHELLSAGIKVWMATGDKLHTAENVAYSCRLIKGDTSIMRCVGESLEEVRTKMAENKEIFDVCVSENRKRALIIQGDALAFVLSDDQLREQFVTIVLDCDAVVCCRVTPKQKADVIRLVKSRTSKVTLAVGDGANDVNMIQAADIGIGLYGQEGMQAVQASDYAIAEFQSLWRLLLVHGRWSYVRISEMILYFFYKNMLFTLPQAFFGIQCSFTGQTIYEDYYVTFYNLMFTALPLVIKAILDQDINYKRIRPSKKSKIQDQGAIIDEDQEIKDQFAELYNYNRNNPLFTITSFLKWVAEGVVVSAILYFCAMGMIGDLVINNQGQTGGMWYFSIALYSAVILIVDIRLALSTRSWTVLYTVILFASVAFYFAYTVFYDDLQFSVSSDTVGLNYGSIQFYTFMLLMAGLSFIVDLTRRTWRNTNRMSLADRLRLHQKLKAKKLASKDSFDYSMEGKSKSLSLQENKRSETHASLVMNGKYEPPRLY